MTRFGITIVILLSAFILLLTGGFWLARGQSVPPSGPSQSPFQPPVHIDTYVHPEYGFSFDYPGDLELEEVLDASGFYIFGDTPSGETRLLVALSPYDLADSFTEEILRLNVADVPQEIDRLVVASITTALLFDRHATPLGATRNAIFEYEGILYHVAVPSGFEHVLDEVVTTWTFSPSDEP